MNGKAELMKYVIEQIYEQKKELEETLKLQRYLNVLREGLANSTSYADFIQKLVQEEGDEEMSSTYRAITNLIKAILREYCDSKAKAEYMLTFLKEMVYEMNEAVKASRVYEKVKE